MLSLLGCIPAGGKGGTALRSQLQLALKSWGGGVLEIDSSAVSLKRPAQRWPPSLCAVENTRWLDGLLGSRNPQNCRFSLHSEFRVKHRVREEAALGIGTCEAEQRTPSAQLSGAFSLCTWPAAKTSLPSAAAPGRAPREPRGWRHKLEQELINDTSNRSRGLQKINVLPLGTLFWDPSFYLLF